MLLIPLVREFLICENGSMNNVLIFKSKRRLRSSSWLAGIHLTNGEKNLTKEEKKIYKKKSFNKQRGEKYKRKYYNKPSPNKRRFFRKAAYCPTGKNNCKCWACEEVRHYANECKNRKNNKLIKTFGSLYYFELNKEEAWDLALKNNKDIVEIILKDEYEDNN